MLPLESTDAHVTGEQWVRRINVRLAGCLLAPVLQHQTSCCWKDPEEDAEDPTSLGTRGHKYSYPPEALTNRAGSRGVKSELQTFRASETSPLSL